MLNDLNWRYATKKFDPLKKIPSENLNELCEVLRLSPSSYGLQPWKFVIVKNPETRKKLKPHAWDQPQVTDADTLIVLCVQKKIDISYVKKFIASIARIRSVAPESLAGYEQMILGSLQGKSPEAINAWSRNQVYIALGMLLSACARYRIDACPMEGFNSKIFDEILGLEHEGLQSVVLCPIGYRAGDDHYAHLAKVRFDKKELFLER